MNNSVERGLRLSIIFGFGFATLGSCISDNVGAICGIIGIIIGFTVGYKKK